MQTCVNTVQDMIDTRGGGAVEGGVEGPCPPGHSRTNQTTATTAHPLQQHRHMHTYVNTAQDCNSTARCVRKVSAHLCKYCTGLQQHGQVREEGMCTPV